MITVLILYLAAVGLYTFIVRNDATHKNVPDVKWLPIIKEGAKGVAIGFAILGSLIFLYSKLSYYFI